MKYDANPVAPARTAAAAGWPYRLLLVLVAALFCGCAGTPRGSTGAIAGGVCSPGNPAAERFDFSRDTFAFPNELTWSYSFDAKGRWVGKARQPKPTYALHCFVLARSAEQFFRFARFDPLQPIADDATYRRLIRRVVSNSPRKHLPDAKRIVFPGYADLRAFSTAHETLVKEECGSSVQCYLQRGNWRMVLPFSRREQEKMANQLLDSVRRDGTAIAHLARFPKLDINHALLLFAARESGREIQFSAYDPNDPSQPLTLTFARNTRTFLLPLTRYFPGGPVNVYQVYYAWNY